MGRAVNRSHKQIDVIVMDFAKAFDKVQHKRLLYKIDFYGVRGSTPKWNSGSTRGFLSALKKWH